ncbi:MAG TPA: methyltransferase domain-containing protein, partial [Bryobacteraceae bacterium]|nr:methyltransferase domain-containing protein [Bryobacteraceae bacterium]
DADDKWLPQRLERQVADLESHPDAAMVYGPTRYWFSWTGKPEDRQRDFVAPLGLPPNTLVKPPALFTTCHPLGEAPSPATCSLTLRRSLLETTGGFEDSFRDSYEDRAFLVKVYLHGNVFVSGDCLANYRIHPDSHSFRALEARQSNRERRIFLKWLEGYLKAQRIQDKAIWRALGHARRRWRYTVLTKWFESGRRYSTRARYKWLRVKRWVGRRTAYIEARPNPIPVSAATADRFPIGATTLSWTAGTETEVEVHVDSPDGPLLSRTAGCGTITTGPWVHDSMPFFLQDVSNGKPLTAENTLDVTVVRVTKPRLRLTPGLGKTRFGDLRRLTPISSHWGFDRGLPVDRHYIEGFLARYAGDIRGRVLEVGGSAYTRRFGSGLVTQSDVLNLLDGVPGTTVVADLACAPQIPSEAFDCVIVTQTLQCIYEVRSAVQTLWRILKPGGVLLATIPGISQTYDPEWGEYWCWNFTVISARRLFEEAFSTTKVQIDSFGNAFTAICFLEGIAAEELRAEELDHHDPGYVVTIAVRAVKSEERP